MLEKGQAVVYHQYLSNCPDGDSYLEAKILAKDQKVGFWNDNSFITPSDWRKGVRSVVSKPITTVSNSSSNNSGGYIASSYKYLRSLGLSRFTSEDPNYTSHLFY